MKKYMPGFIIFIMMTGILFSQNVTTPRVSPPAKVMQGAGLATVTITYHSPKVNGRTLWGSLVPYDNVWRAGANENSVIEFSDDAKVEGKKIPAGKYGFHIIPSKEKWTLIFNKVTTAWGSFLYDESKDQLRVDVKPESAPFRESLAYYFDNATSKSLVAYIHWGDTRAAFKIEFDEHAIVVAKFRDELISLPWYGWQGPYQAANYCATNEINQDEALTWIERSIAINKNFNNVRVKSTLLAQKGNDKESKKLLDEALSIATEAELNAYGYELLNRGEIEKASEIFKLNMDNHPDSWNVHDSYAEILDKKGDVKGAEKYYKKALEMAPENQKTRIEEILKKFVGAN